jgi:hypothetical protein
MTTKRDSVLPSTENLEIDEFTFISPGHLASCSQAACKAKNATDIVNNVFGNMHVSLNGDPCQHIPVAQRAVWNPTHTVKDMAGNAVYRQFKDVVFLTEQQRTTCATLFKFSRMFNRAPHNTATVAEIT